MKSFVKELREMPTQCAKITQKVSFHTKNVFKFWGVTRIGFISVDLCQLHNE